MGITSKQKLSQEMAIDFKEVLAGKKAIIWKEYQKYLPERSADTFRMDNIQKYRKEDDFFWKVVTDYPKRQGKYVRGTLILLTCEAMGGKQELAIKTAAAMQASEDWILTHDDFEDNSEERRGKPALHKIYGPEHAVNAGDALHMIMWKMLHENESVLGHEKASAVFNEMYKMLMRTVFGQSVEIQWTQENRKDLNDEDVFFVIGGKTSYYTIAGPMRLGAIIAGATPQQLETIFEFGTVLGRCFQIKDDLLDLTSDFDGLKKQIGNDLYEGKRTLMLMHLIKNVAGKDKEKLEIILEKDREHKTAEEIKWIIEKMKEYKSLEYGQKKAQELADQAMKIFNEKFTFMKENKAKKNMRSAINYILTRNK